MQQVHAKFHEKLLRRIEEKYEKQLFVSNRSYLEDYFFLKLSKLMIFPSSSEDFSSLVLSFGLNDGVSSSPSLNDGVNCKANFTDGSTNAVRAEYGIIKFSRTPLKLKSTEKYFSRTFHAP